MRPRPWRPALRCALLVMLAACGEPVPPTAEDTDPVSSEPPARADVGAWGPYGVGVRTVEVARGDGLLTVEAWYPAVTGDGVPAAYDEAFPLVGAAVRDAPADGRESLPVVVFSHGYGGVRFQSVFLTEWLASHGFVVLAPDHPSNTLFDLDTDAAATVAARRPGDVSAVIDWARGDGPEMLGLAPWMEGTPVGVVVSSFGAFTSLAVGGAALDPAAFQAHCDDEGGAACAFVEGQALDADLVAAEGQPDPRVTAVVALAPGGWYAFGDDGANLADVVSPLVLAGTRDGDLRYDREGRPTWERMSDEAVLATLTDAGHWGFTDLCGLLPVLEDCAGARSGFMEVVDVHAATRSLTTAHLRVVLRGEALEYGGAAGVTLER